MTTFARPAWVFRRLLGLVYVCAFCSLAVQLSGLLGAGGILPAREYMDVARSWTAAEGVGLARFHLVPTLFWISASDAFIRAVCIAGLGAGTLLTLGVAPLLTTAVAWVAYLSLMTVGQDFLSYQWDALLLETGFFALFVTPARWLDRLRDASAPMRGSVWLLMWLLFRLMVASGAVKLTSGDPTWRALTALTFHFETQPLPTPAAWFVHHAPVGVLKAMCAAVIAVELFAPLLIFGRPPAPTRRVCPARRAASGDRAHRQLRLVQPAGGRPVRVHARRRDVRLFAATPPPRRARTSGGSRGRARHAARVRDRLRVVTRCPARSVATLEALSRAVAPFHIANRYGLFAIMTTTRDEIVVEGSDDGREWRRYEFKYKPGDLKRRPPWVAPHQPRLDWQMWFAALGGDDSEPWFRRFLDRLLEGSPEVLGLLALDPFNGRPPRMVRAELMRFHFSNDGATWWTAEPIAEFTAPFGLK